MKIERIDLDEKFDIIYIDPPWAYDEINHNGNKSKKIKKTDVSFGNKPKVILTGSANEHYNTVQIDDLKEWDFSHICSDDCLMFMWAVPIIKIKTLRTQSLH